MSVRGLALRLVTVYCVLVTGLVLVSGTAWAALTHPFVSSFGSFAGAQSIAVDQGTGDVYVYDAGTGSVDKFTSAGVPAEFSTLKADAIENVGATGASENELAVDNSAGPAKGDIYVANGTTVNVYGSGGSLLGELTGSVSSEVPGAPWGTPCGVAVGGSGDVYVGLTGGHVSKYTPAANPVLNTNYVSSLWGVGEACDLAVDGEGSVYVSTLPGGPVSKYEAGQFSALEVQASGVQVDPLGSTVAVEPGSNDLYVDEGTGIAQYDSTGTPLGSSGRFGPGILNGSYGVAATAAGGLYVANTVNGQINAFGPVVVVPDVTTTSAVVEGTSVKLAGTVNPDGIPVSSCVFEYGQTTAYGQSAPCSSSPGSGSGSVVVDATIAGLSPVAEYHYRLTTANANGENQAQDGTFIAPSTAPAIGSESVVDIASTSAVLQAQINPDGADTTYRFEYGTTQGSYTKSVPVPDGDVGSGTSIVPVGVHIQELQASTTYHYRLVATNEIDITSGSDQTFMTQAPGSPLVLPDGRQWELVSPPNKDGAEILGIKGYSSGGLVQASEDGSEISYLTNAPVEAEPRGNGLGTQMLSRRGTGGWSSQDISSSHKAQTGVALGSGSEYEGLSTDLSRGIVHPEGAILQPGELGALVYDIGGDYMPLGQVFLGGTPDLSHVLFRENEKEGELLEWAGGKVQPVSVLPNREIASREVSVSQRGGISSDGSHVIWEQSLTFGSSAGSSLYDRDTATGETIQIDAPQGGSGNGGGEFQGENTDGSRVFFTSDQQLTLNSTAAFKEPDLYEFVLASNGPLTGILTDLTVDEHAGEHTDISHFNGGGIDPRGLGVMLGISKDGSSVYLVAHGVLAAGATAGEDNLYLLSEKGGIWTTEFIASLPQADESDWSAVTPSQTARVSPDGRFVAFMSVASLTGYDNRDVNSGQLDPEVYLYDSSSGRLVCGSCDPTGARPAGGSSIPGWTSIHNRLAFYQSRYLSDEGRLFFDSASPIVPQDINGQQDVYEFELDGAGGCHLPAGCVGLISGGTGPVGSAFLDASASGGDVFFRTRDQLVRQDFDTAFDVYDAHACSTGTPCFAALPVAPSECTTADSCRTAPSPQPTIFGPPPSATFYGVGNVALPTSSSVKAKEKAKKKPKKKAKKKPRRKLAKRSSVKSRKSSGQVIRGRKK